MLSRTTTGQCRPSTEGRCTITSQVITITCSPTVTHKVFTCFTSEKVELTQEEEEEEEEEEAAAVVWS